MGQSKEKKKKKIGLVWAKNTGRAGKPVEKKLD